MVAVFVLQVEHVDTYMSRRQNSVETEILLCRLDTCRPAVMTMWPDSQQEPRVDHTMYTECKNSERNHQGH